MVDDGEIDEVVIDWLGCELVFDFEEGEDSVLDMIFGV